MACENGSWRIVHWRWPPTVVGPTICWWHSGVLYNIGQAVPFVGWAGCFACRSRVDIECEKTKILTIQAQPQKQLRTRGAVMVDVVDRASPHKWLGCLLHPGGYHHADADFHLQAASRAFHANRWILTDRHVSLATRVRYFDTVITPVACFAAGHRAIFKNDFDNVDVVFRKLLRSVVGPPAATDWSRPWHEILHDWNARVAQFVQHCSVKCCSVRCVDTHWNLAQYAANLPPDLLMWTCRGHHTVGRPRNTSDTTLHLGNWRAVARDANRWVNLTPQFVLFRTESWKRSSEGH